jgi:hypothetical protein
VRRYPATESSFRWPKRSESQPDISFARLDVESAMPSMTPSAAGDMPSTAKKPGNRAVAISCDASERRLVIPMPTTLRLSQEGGVGASRIICWDIVNNLSFCLFTLAINAREYCQRRFPRPRLLRFAHEPVPFDCLFDQFRTDTEIGNQ